MLSPLAGKPAPKTLLIGITKIYAENFNGEVHLQAIVAEAITIVTAALAN